MRGSLFVWFSLTLVTCSAAARTESMPLLFIPNRGQVTRDIRYMVKGSGVTAYFTEDKVVIQAGKRSVEMEFLGTTGQHTVEGGVPAAGEVNFLIGPQEDWRLRVPLFGGITYRNLYPGIDMRYGSNGRKLKSEFLVSPGANPDEIRVRYRGADRVEVGNDGSLMIWLGKRVIQEEPPLIYQVRAGVDVRVEGAFQVTGDVVTFRIGGYDRSLPLTIDPAVWYLTLLGGSGADSAMSLAVDSTGAAYVAGFTSSYDLPTHNPAQSLNSGSNDVFIAKLNPAGNGIVYCTYLGGRGDDRAYGIAVDSAGAVYVAGMTTSSDFPVRGALQTRLAGGSDAFLLKLTASGTALAFSTYLGGNGPDVAYSIGLDSSGNAYLAGSTASTTFPATAYQKSYGGGQDAFVTKVAADGGRIIFSTYLGGSNMDQALAIAVDSSGYAAVTGATDSLNFPVTNAFQATSGGYQDVFVARLAPDGANLAFSTYLGGSSGLVGAAEMGHGIAVDSYGNIYVVGETSSADFPTRGAAQLSNSGWQDAFAAKFSPSGTLLYSSYLGGVNVDSANGVALDAQGNAYAVGATTSPGLASIPGTTGPATGFYDAFIAQLTPNGDTVGPVVYLGGGGSDTATSVVVDGTSNVYVAGWTLSPNMPVVNGFQTINAGNFGAFIGKINLAASLLVYPPTTTLSPFQSQQFTATIGSTANAAVTWTISPAGMGSISTSGLYRAPTAVSSGQTVTVIATGAADPSKTGTSRITLLPNQPPSVVSVTPSGGSGPSQTFSFVVSDSAGGGGVTDIYVLINGSINFASGCFFQFYRPTNSIALANDADTTWQGFAAIGSGAIGNSQCTLSGAGASAAVNGSQLTFNIPITFAPSFTGVKSIYVYASNSANLNTGWLLKATWTVPAAPPSIVSVTPSGGSGSSQTFSFVVSDPAGGGAITDIYVLINGSINFVSGCFFQFHRPANSIALANDADTTWQGFAAIGSGSVSNSQCSVTGAGASSTINGSQLTFNLPITFASTFVGVKSIYVYVASTANLNTGWVQKAIWTVPVSAPPSIVSVTPSGGSGASQTFSFVVSDPAGGAAITDIYVLINGSINFVSGCFFQFYRPAVSIALANDADTTWQGFATIGSGAVANSQCTLTGAGASATVNGSQLTFSIPVTFAPTFAGVKSIYVYAADSANLNTGWLQKATWTVPATAPPSIVSVTPSGGSGSSQTFSFIVSDSAGGAAITDIYVLINGSINFVSGCFFQFHRPASSIALANDADTTWQGYAVIGSGTAANSQCSLSGIGASASINGSQLALNIPISFSSAFFGSKKIYVYAANTANLNTGWLQKATWIVP